MDKQKIFNQVVEHLNRQAEKSVRYDSTGNMTGCYYRHPDNPNLRCAIGGIIPDELYDSAMDADSMGERIDRVLINNVKLLRYFNCKNQQDIHFLLGLQIIHDKFEVHEWKKMLISFARSERLTIPNVVWNKKLYEKGN